MVTIIVVMGVAGYAACPRALPQAGKASAAVARVR